MCVVFHLIAVRKCRAGRDIRTAPGARDRNRLVQWFTRLLTNYSLEDSEPNFLDHVPKQLRQQKHQHQHQHQHHHHHHQQQQQQQRKKKKVRKMATSNGDLHLTDKFQRPLISPSVNLSGTDAPVYHAGVNGVE